MGFIGSINDKLRKFFYTNAGILEGREVFIGCSGNFTVEQIISRRCPTAIIHSNDVSMYTSVLGHHITGRPLPLTVVNEELLWMQKYIDQGGDYAAACLSLALSMFKFEKRNNTFAERMWQTYLINFETMLEKTVEKVRKAAEHIRCDEYTMMDVHDYYPQPDGVSIGFLPTYVGGYEKLFQRLDESIQWDQPAYDMLTTERREATIEKMAQGDFILYDDRERDMPVVARVDLPGKRTVWIYSNMDFGKGLFKTKINERRSKYNLLMPEEEIPATAVIKAQEADLPTINHYRSMYLSKKIAPGSGGPCYLVFADDKLFGFLIFQTYSKKGGDKDEIYMLSDFVVPSIRHKRLAKLLIMASKCREMKQILDEKSIRRYTSIMTTAFTENPVSMKYRGIYDLIKRGKTQEGKQFLNYRGEFDQNSTFTEVVKTWSKKFNKPEKQPSA